MKKITSYATALSLILCLSVAQARVYQRNPGDLLNPQWLHLKGWDEAISRPTLIDGVAHQTDLWQVGKPIHLVLQELEALYSQSPDTGHFSLGQQMAWGSVRHQNTTHRYLLFSLHSGSGTLVMRLEALSDKPSPSLNQIELLPPGGSRVRTLKQPNSNTELIQARSHQSSESLRTFYDNSFRSEGWSKSLGDLYLKNGKMRMLHLLSTGQGSEVQISILTADQNPQLEKNP